MKIFSFGGGVQSTAAIVLQAQGKLDYDAFIFANVGDDSENPATLEYIRDIARPFMNTYGIQYVEVAKKGKTLYEYSMAQNRSVPIPAFVSNGSPSNRACTYDWKIRVISQFTKNGGASTENQAFIGLGLSIDEYHRMKPSKITWQIHQWPLIDLRITRAECHRIIKDAGLPDPPKSACYFCPFQSPKRWMTLRAEHPDLFQKAVDLENRLNIKRNAEGRDIVRLHPSLLPLELAVADQPLLWDEMSVCESGFCFT